MAIMVHRIRDRLRVVGFQLRRRDRNAVQIQHQVEAVFIRCPIPDLPNDPQPVGHVALLQFGVRAEGGTELAQGDGLAQAHDLQPVAQRRQRALPVERRAQPVQQDGGRGGAVDGGQGVPGLGLGFLDPGDQVVGEQGARSVMVPDGVGVMQPAVLSQMGADGVFQRDFAIERHASCCSGRTKPRTSTIPSFRLSE